MKPKTRSAFRNPFLSSAIVTAAFALCATSASADTVYTSVDLRILSDGGVDTGALSLYNDGGNVQRSFLQFDLSSYSGKSITSDATLTLVAGIYGNNLTGVSIGTANSSWNAGTINWSTQPGLTAIPGATNPDGGPIADGADVTWTIPWYMLEKIATTGSGYNNGIGITAGIGSTQHFYSSTAAGTDNDPTLTFSAATAAGSTWTGGNGNWTDTANWAGSTVAEGIGQSATINGGSAVNITMDANRSVGSLSFSGADHTISSGAGKLALNVVSGSPTITVETGRIATIGATVVGIDGLTKSGLGTLMLSGNNSYTGGTTVNSGRLSLAAAGALPSGGGVAIGAGATLSNDAPSGTSFNLGALTLNGGTLAATAAPAGDLGNFHLKGDVTVGGGSMSTISADVRVIQNDDRNFNVADVDAGNGVDLLVSGRLGHYNGNTWGFATKTGAGTMKLTGDVQIGGMTVSGGKLILEDAAAGWGVFASGFTNNSQVEFSVTSGDRTSSVPISGSGTLLKTGDGNMTLSAANTFTGDTQVSGGKIILGNASALQNSVYDTTGSTGAIGLDVNAQAAPTLGGVKGSVNLATAITGYSGITTLNLNPQTGVSATYSGNITDGATAMNLNKSGAGTQTLAGNNSYSGTTIVTGGTLAFTDGSSTLGNITNSGGSLAFSGTSVVTGGTLHFQSYNPQLTISGNADVTLTGGITHQISTGGDPYHAANYNFSGGTLRTSSIAGPSIGWNQSGASMHFDGTRIVATADNSNFIATTGWDAANTINLGAANGAIIDTDGYDIGIQVVLQDESGQNGKLTKLGSGTLMLSSNNTYTGDTLVAAGTLLVNGGLGNTAVTVASNASIGGSGSIAGSLNFGDGAKLTVNLADPLFITGAVTFNGFDFTDIIGWDYASAADGIYTLLAGDAIDLSSGVAHVGLGNALSLGGGRSAYFQEGSLQVVVIPEPGAALIGGLGLLALLRRRRS